MMAMSRRMLSRDEETPDDIEVTRADQAKINRFSSLHQKQSILEEELDKKHQEKDYLTDLTTELDQLELLSDDISSDDGATLHVPYKIGDAFVHLPIDTARDMIAGQTESLQSDVERLEERLGKGREEMEALKVGLYAKFGRAINLEV